MLLREIRGISTPWPRLAPLITEPLISSNESAIAPKRKPKIASSRWSRGVDGRQCSAGELQMIERAFLVINAAPSSSSTAPSGGAKASRGGSHVSGTSGPSGRIVSERFGDFMNGGWASGDGALRSHR